MELLDTARFLLWGVWHYRAVRMSPAALRAVQQRRLRRLLRHAAARSPFYRAKFAGIDLGRCRLADLPVTTKEEMMADFDRVVTDPRVRRAELERYTAGPGEPAAPFLGRYPVCHTSGSQGQPLLVVHDPLVLDLLFSFQMMRGNVAFGPLELVSRPRAPARLAVLSSARGLAPSVMAWRHAPAAFFRCVRVLTARADDPALVEKLNAFRPTALTSFPSALEPLAREAGRLRALGELRQVTTHSEQLTDATRRRLREAFGVPVVDNYALGECLFLSNGCRAGPGTHVNADWAILEVVDRHNRPVPPGTAGDKALVTNLANAVQPFIRYEVPDRVVMATGGCGCGSRLPRVERIDGRSADVFRVRAAGGERLLSVYVFQSAFNDLLDVREWQATQLGPNVVLVRVEMVPGRPFDAERIRRLLREQTDAAGLDGSLELRLEVVERLEADPATGKFSRFLRADA
jgi:phenylacetate-CoA ligase